MSSMIIRPEIRADHAAIEEINREAFGREVEARRVEINGYLERTMKNMAWMSVVFWACLGLALVLAQCATAQKQDGPSFDNPDKLIEVSVGQEFRIVLEANPTTGFTWQLAVPLDDSLLTLMGNTYDSTPTPGRTGVGGKQTWTFKSKRRGQTVIALQYARPWEKGVDPAKKIIFSVFVR